MGKSGLETHFDFDWHDRIWSGNPEAPFPADSNLLEPVDPRALSPRIPPFASPSLRKLTAYLPLHLFHQA